MPQALKVVFQFYKPFFKKYRLRFILLFLMPTFWCVAETVAPYLIKMIIDEISLNKASSPQLITTLVQSSLLYVFLILMMELTQRLCSMIWIKTMPQLKSDIRAKTLKLFQSQHITFFNSHPLGDLVTKYKQTFQSFDEIISHVLYGIYPTIISSLVAFIFILKMSQPFAIFFCIWYLGMNWITYYFAQKSFQASNKQAFSENKLMGHLGDLFRNNITTRIFLSEQLDANITQNLEQKEVLDSKKLAGMTFYTDSLRSLISFVMLAVMMIALIIGWQQGALTLGDFSYITAVSFYLRRAAWMSSIQLFGLFKQLGIASQALKKVCAIPKDIPFKSSLKPSKGELRIENLEFGYGKNTSLFKGLQFTLKPGEKIGLRGPSGSGKSSLLSLMIGFFIPRSGTIYLDGIPIEELSKEDLMNSIAYVPQVPTLFHRSIYDNIVYGNPEAKKEDVLTAAKLANCEKFIDTFPAGYKTIIGENGAKLSGGQCQRIALARCLLKKSPILILDESFSALDQKNEFEILNNILKTQQHRSILFVSHREASLKKMDRIITLTEGQNQLPFQ